MQTIWNLINAQIQWSLLKQTQLVCKPNWIHGSVTLSFNVFQTKAHKMTHIFALKMFKCFDNKLCLVQPQLSWPHQHTHQLHIYKNICNWLRGKLQCCRISGRKIQWICDFSWNAASGFPHAQASIWWKEKKLVKWQYFKQCFHNWLHIRSF